MITLHSHLINGEAAFDRPALDAELAKHEFARITVEGWSETKERSEQQTKWWKGVLLPSLAADTGDTVTHWETVLKLSVMPDEFAPTFINSNGIDVAVIPSITKLSCRKMNLLIDGSVEWLQNNGFDWVTLPCSELRK
ncbi:MAG: hypothetical protein WDK95_10620 [Syntrophorhabdaceae bacterium]